MTFSNDNAATYDGALGTARTAVRRIAKHGPTVALIIVFLWFGGMKFTAPEAAAIEGLMANSPYMFVLLDMFGQRGASNFIGVIELSVAVLLIARFFSPALGALGAAGSAMTYLITLTFFFTTPGVTIPELGIPAISVVPGQFLLKDTVLLVASFIVLNDTLNEMGR